QSKQAGIEVLPLRVGVLDQLQLPGAVPALQRLLSPDRLSDEAVHFIPDQRLAAVTLGKAFYAVLPMLADAFVEVRGHADVKNAERATGQNVGRDEGAALVHGRSSDGQPDPRVKPEDDGVYGSKG